MTRYTNPGMCSKSLTYDNKPEKSDAGSKASIKLKEKICKNPCDEKTNLSAAVWKEVREIWNKSESMQKLWEKITDRTYIIKKELKQTDMQEIGGVSWLPKDTSRTKVGIGFGWSRVKSCYILASIAAHEAKHAEQILERKFLIKEAAPFIPLKKYIIARWIAELEAFEFQWTVIKEWEKYPEYKQCTDKLIRTNSIFVLFKGGVTKDLIQSDIVENYKGEILQRKYKEDAQNVSIHGIKAVVEEYFNSLDLKNKMKEWESDYSTEVSRGRIVNLGN